MLCGICKKHVWGAGFQLNHRAFKQMMIQFGAEECNHTKEVYKPWAFPIMGHCPVCDRTFDRINIYIMPKEEYEAQQKAEQEQPKSINLVDFTKQHQGGEINGPSERTTGDGPTGEEAELSKQWEPGSGHDPIR